MARRHAINEYSRKYAGALVLGALLVTVLPGLAAAAPSQSEFLARRGMPYDAFDRLPHTILKVPGASLQVGFAPGQLALPDKRVLAWIEHSANVVAGYYGRFPVASARILIVPVDGRGVRGGTTWGYRGGAIRLLLGSQATEDDLKQDWKIVHEMVHLALPDINDEHSWLSEGLATYIEPIARAQAGDLSEESIWAAMVRDMPKGLPQPGDRGLDNTSSWASTYWGGGLFCLLADVDIRKQSGNRLGLQNALRGILAAGGNQTVKWPIERVLSTADKAVGGQLLVKLYAQMGRQRFVPDLDGLWHELGIKLQPDGAVVFDDNAPLARIRKAITQRPK